MTAAFSRVAGTGRQYVDREQAAAAEVWIQRLLADGTSSHGWDDRDDAATRARAPEIALPGSPTTWPTREAIRLAGRWDLRNPAWSDVLWSLVAASGTPGARGAVALDQLHQVQTGASRLRLASVKVAGPGGTRTIFMASAATQRRLTVFLPSSGVFGLVLGALSPREVPTAFHRLMRQVYPHADLQRSSTHEVQTTDVFFTWFGPPKAAEATSHVAPPAGATKQTKGLVQEGGTDKLEILPDRTGPVAMVEHGRTTGGQRPRVKFCCEAIHRRAFEKAFAAMLGREWHQRLELVTIDDHVGSEVLAAFGPPDADLATFAGQVINSIRDRIYPDRRWRGTPPRKGDDPRFRWAAHAKDVWSLLCLYRFGGYHLDTGVLPASDPPAIRLPPPPRDALQTMMFDEEGGTSGTYNMLHVPIDLPGTGVDCLLTSMIGIDLQTAFADVLGTPRGTVPTTLPDVGLLRSGREASQTERALRTFLTLWFLAMERGPVADEVRTWADLRRSEVPRIAVITAVATGMTHPGPMPDRHRGNHANTNPGDSAFRPPRADDMFRPADLGLRKTGGGSHRVADGTASKGDGTTGPPLVVPDHVRP